MANNFIFSKEHLIMLLIFSLFMYICPKLTKNLLPYSYIVEKVICFLIVFEIAIQQLSIWSMGDYDVLTCLPIGASRFCAYMCIAILYFKQYHLFNIFFSWSLVCGIGEMIFFTKVAYRYPNVLHFLFMFSKMLLIYANVYMIEVRKFKISKNAIKDNLMMCIIYFSSLIFLNVITSSNYHYAFDKLNLASILIFIIATSITYIPIMISSVDNFNFKLRK